MKTALLTAALGMLLVGLPGCIDSNNSHCYPTDCDLNHILLLHDITYEWNEDEHELSGHFILSNLYPNPANVSQQIKVEPLFINGHFSRGEGGLRDHWDLGYDDYQQVIIKAGESMVFNYTFPEQSRFKNNSINWTPDIIKLFLGARYFEIQDSQRSSTVTHFYRNDCLELVHYRVIQDDAGECSPWRDYWDRHLGWYYKIGDGSYFPPPEVWPTWTDDSPIPLSTYPQFRKHVEFLQGFDLESANIVYFEGEID